MKTSNNFSGKKEKNEQSRKLRITKKMSNLVEKIAPKN